MADYGDGWRGHRRFALTTLRNFGLGKRSMEQRILEEVKYICAQLEESAGTAYSPVTFNLCINVTHLLTYSVSYVCI